MKRRGMTMVEVTAGVAVVGAGAALVTPLLNSARVTAMRATETANLQTFGVGQASYGMDHQDVIATFSWAEEDGERNWESQFDDLNQGSPRGVLPGLWQAVDIVRRGTGDDGSVISRGSGFVAHRQHSHLVLLDYLGLDLYEEFTVSPGDTRLQLAHETILNAESFAEGNAQARKLFPTTRDMGGQGGGVRPLLPYISSYQMVPFAYVPDSDGGGQDTASPSTSGHWLHNAADEYRPRRTAEVAFPGQKVLLFGTYDYASIPGRPIYYAYREAKAAQLFFDGSAGINATIDANFGINPRTGQHANFPFDWQHSRGPDEYAPPEGVTPLEVVEVFDDEGEFVEIRHLVNGYYRWTASGLKGIDFGAKPLHPFGWELDDPYGD